MRLVAEGLMVIGAMWVLLAAVGIVRFDDVYARLHAATKSTTLGVACILIGAAITLPIGDATKLVLAGVFLFVTAPIGAHLVGRAVHRSGVAAVRIDTVDELRDADRTDGGSSSA